MISIAVQGLAVAKQHALWGTNGKGGMEHCRGKCPEHQIRWVRLIDCESDHLKAILKNCPHILGTDYETIILSILADREDPKRQSRDVHTEHCCSKHGCKYGDEDCPVEKGEKLQSYPCEACQEADQSVLIPTPLPAEKVLALTEHRDKMDFKTFLYFVDGKGSVCRLPRIYNDLGKPEAEYFATNVVVENAVTREEGYLYFIDDDGDISRRPISGK